MGVVLLLVFRSRPRLLPLGIALAAAGITFGAVSLVGGTLTMASIAVLPILIGLAVDYAIQFQARAQEARAAGAGGPDQDPASAVAHAASTAAPTIATAALATAAGFLALLLSPVPMVRGFGLLLIVGIAIALACALTAGSAAMVLAGGRRRRSDPRWLRPPARRWNPPSLGVLGASARGAGEILGDARDRAGVSRRVGRVARGAVAGAVRHPGRVLLVGLVLAAAGWVADTQMPVQSDVTKLVPSNMPALQNLRTLERVTGVSGEIDVVVHSSNVATPTTIGWMVRYENTLLAHFGYVEEKGCAKAALCPALSLPDLFCSGTQATSGSCSGTLTTGLISSLLKAVPPYFSQAVITPRPPRGDARVRHPPDAAVPPAAADRLHAGAHASAVRRQRRARRPAGARGPGGCVAVLVGSPDADAAGRTGRGRAGAARGSAHGAASARSAGADRAGDGLVVADPVRDPDPAEPDVGRARRARDRDLHRVQRAPVRAVPPGAPRRALAGRRAGADLPVHRIGRARLRDHGDRGVRRAHAVEHHDAARLRAGDARRPVGVARRRAARAAVGARPVGAGDVRSASASVSGRVAGGLPRRRRARVA